MLTLLLALAAANLGPQPPDLVLPGEESAYAAELSVGLDRFLKGAADAACQPTLRPQPAIVVGPAGAKLGARPTDPVDPAAIVYEVRIRVTGCGLRTQQANLLAVRRKTGGWLISVSAPGETVASPRLLRDVYSMALSFAVAGRPQGQPCTNGKPAYQLIDTRIVTPPSPSAAAPEPWQERWVQQSCGEDRTVLITFTPTADGGTDYLVKPQWASATTGSPPSGDAAPHP